MAQYLNTMKNKALNVTNKLLLFTTIFLFGGYGFLILSREHFLALSQELFGETTYIMNSLFLDIALRKPLILLPIIASIIIIINYKKQQNPYLKMRFNLISLLCSSLVLSALVYSIYVP